MTKGTKIFRIIICVLLALTMIFSALFAIAFIEHMDDDVTEKKYGIYVAGKSVTNENKDDILGDGTVYYNPSNNTLTLDNATIEYDYTTIYSSIDLNINLIGENKIISTNEEYSVGLYVGDSNLGKDLAILGDGSLTVELPNPSTEAAGIFASEFTALTDVTVITSDCENAVHGIVCGSSFLIVDKATVTVKNGAAKYSAAVRVRSNTLLEEGTTLNVSVNPGTTGTCRGLSTTGDLYLGKNSSLNVSIDDSVSDLSECIHVSGLMEVEKGSTVTASSKNVSAIECFGSIEANEDTVITAVSDKNDVDIFCNGTVVNRGAEFNGKIDALGGIHNRD